MATFKLGPNDPLEEVSIGIDEATMRRLLSDKTDFDGHPWSQESKEELIRMGGYLQYFPDSIDGSVIFHIKEPREPSPSIQPPAIKHDFW